MTRKRSSSASRTAAPTERATHFALDPYFACLIFAGVGIGTALAGLAAGPRLILLWMTLLVLWVAYREGQTIPLHYRFADIGRGAGIGLVIGAPAMLIALRGLAAAVPILFTGKTSAADTAIAGATVFTSLVLLAPFAEELFFRDILQRERGLRITIVLYAVAAVIFFLPTAGDFPVVLAAVSGATAVLGIVYAFLYERFGLTLALTCHTAVNFILLFVPTVLSQFEILQ